MEKGQRVNAFFCQKFSQILVSDCIGSEMEICVVFSCQLPHPGGSVVSVLVVVSSIPT